jgi:hypothetical protein
MTMHLIALLATLVILGLMIYQGYQGGLFASAVAFTRNVLAFVCAMTFCEPLAVLVLKLVPSFELYPGPLYLRVIAFATAFGIVMGVGNWLNEKFLSQDLLAHPLADRIGGTALGLLSGVIISGFVLILCTMMPFLKCIPGDFGRIQTDKLLPDSGGIMLRIYGWSAGRMGGNRMFLLEDEPIVKGRDANHDGRPDGLDINGDGRPDALFDGTYPPQTYQDLNKNGVWDRGWLWLYRHHADFYVEDVELASTTKKTVYE